MLLIGPPGVGKTHLAVGLAARPPRSATAPSSPPQRTSQHTATGPPSKGRWAYTTRSFAGPTLRVIDELGYPDEAASALVEVVSQRYLKSSIVLTTNLGVASWGEISATYHRCRPLLDRLGRTEPRRRQLPTVRDHHAHNDTLRQTTTGTRQPLH